MRGPAVPPSGQAQWAQSAARLPHAAPNPVSVSLLDVLLDDVILTHSLFLPTEHLLQELHQ